MQKIPIRRDSLDQLQEELKQLKTVERPQIIKAISEAREHGDLSENANTMRLEKDRVLSRDV